LLLFVSIPLVSSISWRDEMKRTFNLTIDEFIYNEILSEEAAKTNRTAATLEEWCFLGLPMEFFSFEKKSNVNIASDLVGTYNSDEVLSRKEENSSLYAKLKKTFEKFIEYAVEKRLIAPFAKDIQEFLQSVDTAILDSLESMSQHKDATDAEKKILLAKGLDSLLASIITNYHEVSESSKNQLERLLCLRTFYRIADGMKIIKKLEKFVEENSHQETL
ncbi:hypothetical protein PMAYCL1PPCAC_06067, partial [Pristionchus mayeri]